jgi:hypothetical protein
MLNLGKLKNEESTEGWLRISDLKLHISDGHAQQGVDLKS